MKYILYPILTITIVLTGLCIVAPIKFLWNLIWSFKLISFRQATKDLFVIDNPIDGGNILWEIVKEHVKEIKSFYK